MATAAYTSTNYQVTHIPAVVHTSLAKSAPAAEVTFVPEAPDVRKPIRRFVRTFQWRRQLSDYIGSVVSGAVSLR